MKASGDFKNTQVTKDRTHLSHHLNTRCHVQTDRQKPKLEVSVQGKIPSVSRQTGTTNGWTALGMHRVFPSVLPAAWVIARARQQLQTATQALPGKVKLYLFGNFTLCSLFWHKTDDKTHMGVFLNYAVLGNWFSPLEVHFLRFSCDTCSNTSPSPKASEMPRSHWLLVKHSLEYLNPLGRFPVSHMDVFRMIPLHLLRLHYPCVGQGAKAIPTLLPTMLPADTSGHHGSALLCKSCVHKSTICQTGRKSTVCCRLKRKSLFAVIHGNKEKIKWENVAIFKYKKY